MRPVAGCALSPAGFYYYLDAIFPGRIQHAMSAAFHRHLTRIVTEIPRMIQVDIAGPSQRSHAQTEP
jgi:hypothetical protein